MNFGDGADGGFAGDPGWDWTSLPPSKSRQRTGFWNVKPSGFEDVQAGSQPGNLVWVLAIVIIGFIMPVAVADDSITKEMRQFLAQHIHSVEQLEIFLVLGEDSSRSWSVREIFQKIQSSEKSIGHCLERFLKESLVTAEGEGQYRLSEKTLPLIRMAVELKEAYRQRHLKVIEVIYPPPLDSVRKFAAAFKLRKDQ